jgi:hypothetical protein
MTTLLKRAVPFIIAALALNISVSIPVGASQYGAWGNNTLGDCPFAADANLVRMHWPKAPLNGNGVVSAWHKYGGNLDGYGYLQSFGFDGHHATGFTTVRNRSQFISAANSGGVLATVLSGTHEAAVIGANQRGLTFVSWGTVFSVTWSTWKTWKPGYLAAVHWAPQGTVAVPYDYQCPPDAVATQQSETPGSVETLQEPAANSDSAMTFAGWSSLPGGAGTMYQPGAAVRITQNVALWANWHLNGQLVSACV